jgi:Holliday junction resolvasome RuvABC endonuclease subunit
MNAAAKDKSILAFDIARKVGIALIDNKHHPGIESWIEEFPLWEGRPNKSHRFTQAETLVHWMTYLERLLEEDLHRIPDVIAWEDLAINARSTKYMSGDWIRLYCGMRGILLALAERYNCIWLPYTVQQIKKKATGNGNAPKEMIMEASLKMWPHNPPEDDNEADARWCALLAAETIKELDI